MQALFCASLSGCASGSGAQIETGSANAKPAAWRQLAQEHVRRTFKDPYSIRDGEIAEPYLSPGPVLMPGGFGVPWIVCVRANAKNAYSAYEGASPVAILIHNGKVQTSHENPGWQIACEGLKYAPFPEINGTA